MSHHEEIEPQNFIEEIIVEDLKSGKHKDVTFRFPRNRMGFCTSAM